MPNKRVQGARHKVSGSLTRDGNILRLDHLRPFGATKPVWKEC